MTTAQRPTTPAFPTTTAARSLLHDFLAWLAVESRPYSDVMDAWRTSCPRLSIWEDALAEGLVKTERGSGDLAGQIVVKLTPAGRALVEAGRDDPGAERPSR